MTTRRRGGQVDPHWWQDPRNALRAVDRIRDALVAADPGGQAAYTANAAAYSGRLRALDGAIERCLSAIPAARRRLVTDHDALGYFAARYDIDVIGTVIPALSTHAQSSAARSRALVRTIRAAGVTTIFPESSVNAKLTQAIARDAGARVGPGLYADSLGPAGSPGATYLGALRFNARALGGGFDPGARAPVPLSAVGVPGLQERQRIDQRAAVYQPGPVQISKCRWQPRRRRCRRRCRSPGR